MSIALGFDYGEKRIGLAIGNQTTGTSRALGWLNTPQVEAHWEAISTIIAQWQPQTLLVGAPLTAAGDKQPITRKARHFGHELRRRYGLRVEEVDERFSSISAQAELLGARASGGKKRRLRRGDTDSMAAAIIVQQWLESTIADQTRGEDSGGAT